MLKSYIVPGDVFAKTNKSVLLFDHLRCVDELICKGMCLRTCVMNREGNLTRFIPVDLYSCVIDSMSRQSRRLEGNPRHGHCSNNIS